MEEESIGRSSYVYVEPLISFSFVPTHSFPLFDFKLMGLIRLLPQFPE